MIGINLDFRNDAGYPHIDLARQLRPAFVRCVSHPDQETGAYGYHLAGIPIVPVVTGESILPNGEFYIMREATGFQLMNEVLEGGEATWPGTTNLQELEDTWHRIKDAVWSLHGEWFPLIAPGSAYPRADVWRTLRPRLSGVTAAACHVYPMATGHSLSTIKTKLREFRDVEPNLPLLCTEYDSTWPNHLAVYRALRTYCDGIAHFNWRNVEQHAMFNNEKLGILRWAA